ncbi:adhesion G-protein coupled receptor G6 isoform X2 [Periophthalmus magnuspinnatus]|uniref:adhesion G-protein coupled receptor G6 isoform X2 n=1 Tax=Periophthalmus magnuspinnatus TaxID=409849 RepID=UPI00243737D4|nr:adhesion G-protein coupled receptor G6 isoform X2 [Periophthalmus magnuspinnatus]
MGCTTAGGRWSVRGVFPLVLLWMFLHTNVLSCVAPDCNLALQGTHGAMKSPCYPQKYPNSHTCRWTIQAPTGHIVQLTFVDFELEEAPGCIYDWVIVNTGQTDVRFCGLTARGLSLNSTGNLIVLSFNSDFSVQKRGFYVEYRHVAVDMRNQKITVNSGNGQVTKVSSSVSMPTLSHLTVCFEAQRISLKQKEWLFTYYDSSSNVALSFGADREEMKVIVDGQECSVNSLITQANLTSTMTPVCVVWTSANGKVVLYYNNRYLSTSCSALSGRSVPAGGLFQLGAQHSFEGFIYNLRLWDYSMSQQQLSALTCDTEGNVIDWDNSYWNVPSTLAQTDASLSCSVSPPSITPLTSSCASSDLGCPASSSASNPSTASTNSTPDTNAATSHALSPPTPPSTTPSTAPPASPNNQTLTAAASSTSTPPSSAGALPTTPMNTTYLPTTIASTTGANVTVSNYANSSASIRPTITTSNTTMTVSISGTTTAVVNTTTIVTNASVNATVSATVSATVNATVNATASPANATATSTTASAQQSSISWTTVTNHPSTNPAAHDSLFYRVAFVVEDSTLTMSHADVEEAVVIWLNQTFQNWTHSVYVGFISVQSGSPNNGLMSYQCQALLVHYFTTNVSLGEAAKTRLSNNEAQLGTGLRIQTGSSSVALIGNCPEEVSVHYRWPESRPTVSHTLPCFPNKDSSTSRTCLISPQNFTSHWSTPDTSNCTVINNIQVSADNAAEVADQLVVITNNDLDEDEVSQVVVKVKELVNVAKINTSLAHTVVTIISNVMKRPETTRPATSLKALKAVDKLAQKIEFEGDTVSITSKHLAVGVSSLNTTIFKGTRFSAFIGPNSSQPEIDFVSKRANPLAQVILPASLLTNISLTEAERTSLSRINFMFFSSTNLFQKEQDGLSLNSYVVASSVGNFTISNLKDPVRIEIAHLTEQAFDPLKPPVCMFWDFTMKEGDGGWNRKGCRISPDSTSNKSVCLCNHLTHFGILMDIYGSSAYINEQNTKILTFITYIGCGISAVFSAVTLLTYIAFEKLRRDYPSKILMNLSTSLLCLNLTFLLDGWLASLSSDWLCVTVAVFLHYFLLTSFTWMGLESIHMYIALVKVFNTYIRRYILKFCLVGWGLPAVIVGIVAAIDKNSYGLQEYGRGARGSSEFCWIKNQVVFYVTCVGYFCLIFLLNVAMFIVVMLQICGRNGKRSNRTLREEVLRNLRSVISLTFLLGMTWGFALFAWGPVNLAFMYLFSIFNSLQGLFIFIFHCALKENVQKQWRRYLCCGRFRLSDNSDWSKTATNNTKKVSSENLGKSLSSSSFGSSTANWTSKAKATLNPFTKRHSNTDSSSNQ